VSALIEFFREVHPDKELEVGNILEYKAIMEREGSGFIRPPNRGRFPHFVWPETNKWG
jgi:hypothetical protein